MLAKIAAWDNDRSNAAKKLKAALLQLNFYGVKNNIPFLIQILDHSDFIEGKTFTDFLERNSFTEGVPLLTPEIIAAAILLNSNEIEVQMNGNPWTDS